MTVDSLPSDESPTERVTDGFFAGLPLRNFRPGVADDLRRPGAIPFLMASFSFLLYCGSLAFNFVWDDRKQIIENVALRTWHRVPTFFTANVWALTDPHKPANYYRPLFLLWLKINYSLFGLSPAGWHFMSVLLQALVTVQVFCLARRLLRDEIPAGIAALIFAVHPVHIESVAWLSGVTDPLVAAFMLAATLLFLRSFDASARSRWPAYAGSLVFAVLALLSKEIAIALPVLLIVTSAATREKLEWVRLGKCVTPFFLLTLAYVAVRHFALHGFMHSNDGYALRWVLLTLPSVVAFYARQLLAPLWMSPYADVYWVRVADLGRFWIPLVICCFLVIAGMAACVVAENRRRLLALYAWIILPLLPALYIPVFPPSELVHDRYLYVPSVGFCVLAVLAAGRVAQKVPRRTLSLATGVALVALCVVTFRGELSWDNEILLYKRAALVAPHNEGALINLGLAYLERNDSKDGVDALNQALELNPHSTLAAANLGHLFLVSNRYADAEPMFRRALWLNPHEEEWQEQFAEVELRLGKIAQAEEAARQAIRLRPDGEEFHLVLGAVLLAKGDRSGAEQAFVAELRMHPEDTRARDALDRLKPAKPQPVAGSQE
ncbi:MAG TPA: tetratricopeptide repeat protein [Terriglobales bacterium]|nr:tetratricopeptide repeat protein [Terriglobales bacterium]